MPMDLILPWFRVDAPSMCSLWIWLWIGPSRPNWKPCGNPAVPFQLAEGNPEIAWEASYPRWTRLSVPFLVHVSGMDFGPWCRRGSSIDQESNSDKKNAYKGNESLFAPIHAILSNHFLQISWCLLPANVTHDLPTIFFIRQALEDKINIISNVLEPSVFHNHRQWWPHCQYGQNTRLVWDPLQRPRLIFLCSKLKWLR